MKLIMTISPREVILRNLHHDDPPRIGMTFDGGRMNDVLLLWPDAPRGYRQKRWVDGNREYYDDEWGNVWVRMVGGSEKGEIHRPVLSDWGKLDDLIVPDYDDPACFAGMKKVFSEPTDRFRLAIIGGWVFDNARYLRKLENYLVDMALHPEEIKRLNAKVASVYETKIHGAGKAGADGVMVGEDLGTQTSVLFSPSMFREFFKEEYTRLVGIAHDYGMKVFLHSCGQNWALLDDLIECGFDCFQFDQPRAYDMPALARKLREHKVALWSPVDIQQVLPTGDRERIEREAECMVETFRGGLIAKNYPDLHGIGVKPEWDQWAYEVFLRIGEEPAGARHL